MPPTLVRNTKCFNKFFITAKCNFHIKVRSQQWSGETWMRWEVAVVLGVGLSHSNSRYIRVNLMHLANLLNCKRLKSYYYTPHKVLLLLLPSLLISFLLYIFTLMSQLPHIHSLTHIHFLLQWHLGIPWATWWWHCWLLLWLILVCGVVGLELHHKFLATSFLVIHWWIMGTTTSSNLWPGLITCLMELTSLVDLLEGFPMGKPLLMQLVSLTCLILSLLLLS